MAKIKLWQYNRITGYWAAVRTVNPETAHEWLTVYQSDDPFGYYQVGKNRPSGTPKGEGLNRAGRSTACDCRTTKE